MNDLKSKIIVCETCYSIPKLEILTEDKVKLKCSTCGEKTKNISYFDKFMNNINNEFTDMPKCNYNHSHEIKSISYCFYCTKYLCENCIQNHNIAFKENNHLLINQRIKNKYYCQKEGHQDFILFKYCTLCNDYLCSKCICNHGNNNIYNFEDADTNRINEIINKVKKCEEIIRNEEKKLNIFIKEIENKIKVLKDIFKNYKERNLKLIALYKLIINNYSQINRIRNFNINNNIIINNNFDLSDSDYYIKEKDNKNNECLSSIYNKLFTFYNNKNHIRTKQYVNHLITQKFCNKNIIKKCISMEDGILIFIFSFDKYVYLLYKNNDGEYDIKNAFASKYYINDIYYYLKRRFISIDSNNCVRIFDIDHSYNIQLVKKKDYSKDSIIIKDDLSNIDNYFVIENLKNTFSIYYNDYLLFKDNKSFNIKCLYNNIFEKIGENYNKLEIDYKKKLKSIIDNLIEENIEHLDLFKKVLKIIKIDKELYSFLDKELSNLFNNVKDKLNLNDINKYVVNSNYILFKFQNKLNNVCTNTPERKKIENIINFKTVCSDLRKIYMYIIVLNTRINNIYNFNNEKLIFMGPNYLIITFSLKSKEFLSISNGNLFPNAPNNNIYEISYISSDNILLNDIKNKTINIIELNNNLLLQKNFKYYSNISIDNNYLLYDSIKNNEIIFSIFNLLNDSFGNLKEILNFKINYDIPKILFWKKSKKLILLYEKNQLCIDDYIFNNKNNHENTTNIINNNNNKIIIKEEKNPKIIESSEAYDKDYTPDKLFKDKTTRYYCTKSPNNQFIILDYGTENYIKGITIYYLNDYARCKPKQYKISILGEGKSTINVFL